MRPMFVLGDLRDHDRVAAQVSWTCERRHRAVLLVARRADDVRLVRFENLIADTETTMRSLAAFLGLDWNLCLLSPTFNRYPVRAASSFAVTGDGILTEPRSRAHQVSPVATHRVQRATADLHAEALTLSC